MVSIPLTVSAVATPEDVVVEEGQMLKFQYR